MQTVNNPARPFTKDTWMGFAGCEEFKLGGHGTMRMDRQNLQPVIREVNDTVLLIADANGIGAHFADDDNEWLLDLAFPTQALAMQFLNSFSEDVTPAQLDELGFTCL